MKKALLVGFLALLTVPFSVHADSGTWLSDASFSCPAGTYTLSGSHGTFYSDIYLGTFHNGSLINGHLGGGSYPSDCSGISTTTTYFVVFFPATSLTQWRAYNAGGGTFPGGDYAILQFPTDQQILEGLTFGTTSPTMLHLATTSGFTAGLSATSTLESLGGQCAQAGNLFAEGLCTALTFLFVPNVQTITNLVSLPELAKTKIPFSYVASISTAVSSAQGSTTANFPLISIPLSQYASSTLTGSIPDVTISTSTISTLFPDWARFALQALIIAGMWYSAGLIVFREALKAPPTHKT